jgi:hypothetical protein
MLTTLRMERRVSSEMLVMMHQIACPYVQEDSIRHLALEHGLVSKGHNEEHTA